MNAACRLELVVRVFEIQTDDAIRRPLKDREIKRARGVLKLIFESERLCRHTVAKPVFLWD